MPYQSKSSHAVAVVSPVEGAFIVNIKVAILSQPDTLVVLYVFLVVQIQRRLIIIQVRALMTVHV